MKPQQVGSRRYDKTSRQPCEWCGMSVEYPATYHDECLAERERMGHPRPADYDPITRIIVDLNARRITTQRAIDKLKEICNG